MNLIVTLCSIFYETLSLGHKCHYERRTNNFQTLEIWEDHGKTEICTNASFVRTYVSVA